MNNEEKILSILETMDGRLETMDGRLETMDGRLSRLESDVSHVKGSVIRLEKNQGIHTDGIQQLNDKFDRIERHVSAQDEVILKRVFPLAMDK